MYCLNFQCCLKFYKYVYKYIYLRYIVFETSTVLFIFRIIRDIREAERRTVSSKANSNFLIPSNLILKNKIKYFVNGDI